LVIVAAIVFMPRGFADLVQRFRQQGWRYFQENIKAHRV
jgi:branched-chain amino acid transport system permease protein